MGLILPALSSTLIGATGCGGTRDYDIDLAGDLEAAETLATADVVSSDTEVLEATFVSISGTKVNFTVKSKGGPINRTVPIDIPFTGSAGSADTYIVEQQIVPKIKT